MSDWPEEREEVLLGLADALPTDGKLSGYVKIPYSSDLSAYGFIALPIVVVGNGDGPTALLMAGSQGDEFEGQIALSKLARKLQPKDLTGRVIILPMANAPAASAGRRNSPIDGINLNRIFPGDVRGLPTSTIANYIERHLMPLADIVLDLHSGGRSLKFLPCATLMHHADGDELARRLAVAVAFNAPSIMVSHGFEERNSSGASKRAGAVRIGAEIGGGGDIEKALVDMTYDCVMNTLNWSGITTAEAPAKQDANSIVVREVVPVRDHVYTLSDGLFEAAVVLGDHVKQGDLAGHIYDPSRPLSEPRAILFNADGVVVCLRAQGLSARGDCVAHVARPADERLFGEVRHAAASTWVRDIYQRRRPRRSKLTPQPAASQV